MAGQLSMAIAKTARAIFSRVNHEAIGVLSVSLRRSKIPSQSLVLILFYHLTGRLLQYHQYLPVAVQFLIQLRIHVHDQALMLYDESADQLIAGESRRPNAPVRLHAGPPVRLTSAANILAMPAPMPNDARA